MVILGSCRGNGIYNGNYYVGLRILGLGYFELQRLLWWYTQFCVLQMSPGHFVVPISLGFNSEIDLFMRISSCHLLIMAVQVGISKKNKSSEYTPQLTRRLFAGT